jgi:hypothetical protein
MAYFATQTLFAHMSREEIGEVEQLLEAASVGAKARFDEWLGAASGKEVDWDELASQRGFVEALLVIDGFKGALHFEPLFLDVWAHYPAPELALREIETNLWRAEAVWAGLCHWWSLRTETYSAVIWQDEQVKSRRPVPPKPFRIGRRFKFPEEVIELRALHPPVSFPWMSPPPLDGCEELRPFPPMLRDDALHILHPYKIKPWFKDHNNFYYGGGDFDLSLTKYGRGEWQLYFDVKGKEGRSVEFEESLSEALLAHLPGWPGVVEVILEDREAIWIKAKGWKKPAVEIRGLLDRIGAPFSELTVDPKVETG